MAAETAKLEMEREAKCSPHKFYEMIKYSLHHLHTVFPESYKHAALLEGDEGSVGAVREWHYCLPGTTEILVAKGKSSVIDDEKMLMVLDIFEGHLKDHYDHFVITMHVLPKGDGSVVKWKIEYEKSHDHAVDPHHYMELCSQVHEKLDAHVLAKA